jgi:hypothetical protein
MRRIETFDWWPRLVADKDTLSLRELSTKYDVTAGAISAALKRLGIAREGAPPGPRSARKKGADGAPASKPTSAANPAKAARSTGRKGRKNELPPEPGEVVAPSRAAERRLVRPEPTREIPVPEADDDSSRKGSKDSIIQENIGLVGAMPDHQAAAKMGVSVRTLAAYRARNGIPAYSGPRNRAPRPAAAEAAPAGTGRRSKIDPFRDQVGTVPDRIIAERAGVTLNAVRNYRAKHAISASGRGRPRKAVAAAIAAAAPPTIAPKAAPPAPKAAPAAAPAKSAPGTGLAWLVTFSSGDDRVVTAPDIAGALLRASLAGLGDVHGIRRLGIAL